MLAEELVVIDAQSPLWTVARPLLDVALRLEQSGNEFVWHGWNKRQIERVLTELPQHCSLVVGVWEMQPRDDNASAQEILKLGVVCEVTNGSVTTIRTFDTLVEAGLKATKDLEAGFEDALSIMRVARSTVAPVAWALFTDAETWHEWVFAQAENAQDRGDNKAADKAELLATLTWQGRCVLMGSQSAHPHHYH